MAVTPIPNRCTTCGLKKLCLPRSLDDEEIVQLEKIIDFAKPVRRGMHIYHQGDPLHALHIIKSGTIKSYITAPDGSEQVVGFHLAGQILGLDALEEQIHTSSAIALENTVLCGLPYHKFDHLSRSLPHLHNRLLTELGRELSNSHQLLLHIGQKNAEQRLAIFLLDLSARLGARGLPDQEITLCMSRSDIGNFLGMATETVSRTFTHFEQQNILQVRRKRVLILDMERLQKLIQHCDQINVLLAR